jgi:hypothetical protein
MEEDTIIFEGPKKVATKSRLRKILGRFPPAKKEPRSMQSPIGANLKVKPGKQIPKPKQLPSNLKAKLQVYK